MEGKEGVQTGQLSVFNPRRKREKKKLKRLKSSS
jgi:hypothetical protein